jgi:hypothetical protein
MNLVGADVRRLILLILKKLEPPDVGSYKVQLPTFFSTG